MNYEMSKYPYYHGSFKTDEYYGVYDVDTGADVAHFGTKEAAEEYMEFKNDSKNLLRQGEEK